MAILILVLNVYFPRLCYSPISDIIFYKRLSFGSSPPHGTPVMSLNSTWRPAEDELTIINERTWLAGMILSAVAYGIAFTLFILTFRQLMKTTTRHNYSQRLPFIIYITLMLILGTLFVGAIAKMTELSFIDYRMFPGGPGSFLFSSCPEKVVY